MSHSNLRLRSNLMPLSLIPKGEEHRFLPGDYVGLAYPEFVDRRVIDRYLTPKQIDEYEQVLICVKCGKACAGTCTETTPDQD